MIKEFIAGLALPAFLAPFVLHFAGPAFALSPFVHFIPLVWGVWNVLYFEFARKSLPKSLDARLYLTGAVLGLLVALFGVYYLALPQQLGVSEELPLIAAPIVYAILWRFIVHPINELLGLKDR